MGHYCKICNCIKPNEKFSGKGHKTHICKECSKMSIKERTEILQEDEIFGYLKQSYISQKNVKRLNELILSENKKIAEYANIVLKVVRIKPHKKRRLKILAQKRRDLLRKLEETGLILAHHL
jgi:hypothetical protein